MHTSPVLLTIHILLLVAWLGIDVGVFTSSFVMRRPNMSIETRLTVRGLMRNLDLAPRISLILTIPVALLLTRSTGWGLADVSEGLLWVVAVAAIIWAVFSVVSFRATGPTGSAPAWAASFAKLDWGLRAAASVFFVVTGLASLTGSGIWDANWVAWKATLFGLIIAMGLWIRVAAKAYHPALAALLNEGESPERLAAVNQKIRGVYPPVLLIWTSLIVMVVLAIFRP
jgi:hypothetical protein